MLRSGHNNDTLPVAKAMSADRQDRLTTRFVWDEFCDFMALEKGALYTTVQLCLRPGKTIHRYLDGHREKLTNPIRYLLMCCAIVTAAFVFVLPHDDNVESIQAAMPPHLTADTPEEMQVKIDEAKELLGKIELSAEQPVVKQNARRAQAALDETLAEKVAEITSAWMNVFLLFALPINACITWLCFRRSKFNLAEHVVANAYILAIQNIAAVVVVVLAALGIANFAIATVVYMLLSFIYQFVAWKLVYKFRGFLHCLVAAIALVASVIAYLTLQTIVMVIVSQLSI